MTDATRARIQERRRQIERATTEANRWGMVLAAATELRSDVRRGGADADGAAVVSRFERLVEGAPAETTAERREHLGYLASATVDGGPAAGSTFFGHATDHSGSLGSFATTFESFVADDASDAPTADDVLQRFEADAVGPAAGAGDADATALRGLIEVVEAGLRAATAHRDAAVEALNDTYEPADDGSDEPTRVDRGLVHRFHAEGATENSTGGDGDAGDHADGDEASGAEPSGDAGTGYVDRVTELAERPVAMLPVGLQTRFVDDGDDRIEGDPTGDGDELWIRVYPDDVHVDAHEPELTPQEERWGKTFWTQVWLARHPQVRTVTAERMAAVRDGEEFMAVHEGLPDDPTVADTVDRLLVADADGRTVDEFDDDPARRQREIRERAWGLLVERAGRERAAYVVHRTAPVDRSDPDALDTAHAILEGPPGEAETAASPNDAYDLAFPYVEHRPGSWTRQPRALLLPDRWLAVLDWTEAGETRSATVVARNAVREPLHLGPNPETLGVSRHEGTDGPGADGDGEAGSGDGGSAGGSDGSTGSADGAVEGEDLAGSALEAAAPGMEWMVDFDEAERAGMAMRVTTDDLDTDDLPDTFDRVSVLGLKASMDGETASDALEGLLETHHYTRGLELLPDGTPTNNHEGRSAYARSDDPVESLEVEAGAPLLDGHSPTDGTVAARLLGVAPAGDDDHVFAHVDGADGTAWRDAYHMHSLVWPGTVGHTLRHLVAPSASLQTGGAVSDRIEAFLGAVGDHFVQSVRGQGPVPTLRVGDQPYGVLPATALDAHVPPQIQGALASMPGPIEGALLAADDSEDAAYWAILQSVKRLRAAWESSLGEVPHVDPEWAADADAHDAAESDAEAGDASTGDGSAADGDTPGPIDDVLERTAVSTAVHRRHFYLENLTTSYDAVASPSPADAFRALGGGHDPRLSRFRYYALDRSPGAFWNVGLADSRTGSERSRTHVRPAPGYLDGLASADTADLLRLGADLHLEEFHGLFRRIFSAASTIHEWSPLEGVFDWEATDLQPWLAGGDKPRWASILGGVLDTRTDDLWSDTDRYRSRRDELDGEAVTRRTLEERVGSAAADADTNEVAFHLLFVDALDDYFGTGGNWAEVDLHDGTTVKLNTRLQDGHEFFHEDLAAVSGVLEDAFEDGDYGEALWRSWETRLELLFEALTSVVRDQLTFRVDLGDTRPRDERVRREFEEAVPAHAVSYRGGLIEYEGAAFDMPSSPDLHDTVLDALEEGNRIVADTAADVFTALLDRHVRDYLLLGFNLKQSDPDSHRTTFREPGFSALPDDPDVSLETKVQRDSSLFGMVAWYATVNELLAAIRRNDDPPADAALVGRWGEDVPTPYDLFDRTAPQDVLAGLDWADRSVGPYSRGGSEPWHQVLDAMRSEHYVGLEAIDDRLAAFQASLRIMDEEGWLSGEDRVARTGRLFASALDLASHRLDAWWTSLATRRLEELRAGEGGFDLDLGDAWSIEETPQDWDTETYAVDDDAIALEPGGDGTRETYVGAYGFVENLDRDSLDADDGSGSEADAEAATDADAEATPESDAADERETEAEREYEYLQAPSVRHATTAAILRSGYRSHPASDFRERLAVDLSPERVRTARWVTRGLQAGLWLGELLGYYFERRLHQVSEATAPDLERYVPAFREFAPIRETKLDRGEGGDGSGDDGESADDGTGSEGDGGSSAASRADVVDGYRLLEAIQAGDGGTDDVLDAVDVDGGDRAAVEGVFEEIAEIVDAVADLIVAENVHQLQQGNYGQAGRSLEALAEGKMPRDYGVIEADRDHLSVTHRVLVLFGLGADGTGQVDPPDPWNVERTATSPQIAEDGSLEVDGGVPSTTDRHVIVRPNGAPVLNAYAGRIFPEPSRIQCTAAYRWVPDGSDATGDGESADGDETDGGSEDGGEGSGADTDEDDGADGGDADGAGGGGESGDDGSADESAGDEAAGERVVETSIALADLALSPLDALYLTQQSGEAAASRLERHVAYHLLRNRPESDPPVPTDATVDVAFRELPDDAPEDAVSLGDFVELSRSLRDLVLDSRPAKPEDLAHPGEAHGDTRALGTVAGRAEGVQETLAHVRDVLANRLSLVEPPDAAEIPTAADGGGGTTDGSEDESGGDESTDEAGDGESGGDSSGSESADGDQEGSESDGSGDATAGESDGPSTFDRLVEPVGRVAEHLPEYADETNLASVAAEAQELSGDEFVTELEGLLDQLPAGRTEPDPGDDVVVEPAEETVGGALPVGDGADVLLPADVVTASVEADGADTVQEVTAVDVRTGEALDSRAAPAGATDFQVTLELGRVVDGEGPSLRRVRIALEGDGEVVGFPGAAATLDEAAGTVDAVVGPGAVVDGLRADDLTVTVRIESHARAARFRGSDSDVAVSADGSYEASIDFADAAPGTAFDAVAVHESDGTEWVLDGQRGRVVPGADATGVDGSTVASLTCVPRLLWLDGFADAFEPGPPLDGQRARTIQPLASAVDGRGMLADPLGSAGTVSAPDDGSGATDDGTVDPNAAAELGGALGDVDWGALARERALFPDDRTTLSAADRAAVDALLDLDDVDLEGLAEAVAAPGPSPGVVTPVRALGLTEAFSTVRTAAPYGSAQRYYAVSDDALAEARARIRGFLRDPTPSDLAWRRNELLAVDPELLTFARAADLVDELWTLVGLVRDDAWSVETLAGAVAEPHLLVRRVDDLLHHPDALDEAERTDALVRLDELGAAVARPDDPRVPDRAREFESVDRPYQDLARPIRTLADGLEPFARGADPGDLGGGQGLPGTGPGAPGGGGLGPDPIDPVEESLSLEDTRLAFVQSFDDSAGVLRDQTGWLAAAADGADVADALREGLLETLRRPMVRAAYFGVYGAMPAEVTGGSDTVRRNLARQARAVLTKVQERLDATGAVDDPDPQRREIERLRACFGDAYTVLPPFEPPNLAEVRETLGSRDALLDHEDAGPLPVQRWLQRAARVRERPQMLRETLTYADAVNDEDHLELSVGQLPHYPGDDWVGLDGVRPEAGNRLSLVARADAGVDDLVAGDAGDDGYVAGLFVDEWVEHVPSEDEHTAVAFRYDDPDTQPPQSILLAVPPRKAGDGPAWTVDDLAATVEETVDMAKFRAVDLPSLRPADPDLAAGVGHLLPGLFYAQDTHVQPNEPTLDFTPLELYEDYRGSYRHHRDLRLAARRRQAERVADAGGLVDVPTDFDLDVDGENGGEGE